MGTRADFYIGTGPTAEWLGSIAWDGYEFAEAPKCSVMSARTADEFRVAVQGLSTREDFTPPTAGWPWPWTDSSTTDYAYAFERGKTRAWTETPPLGWPDMAEKRAVTFGKRSGLVIV